MIILIGVVAAFVLFVLYSLIRIALLGQINSSYSEYGRPHYQGCGYYGGTYYHHNSLDDDILMEDSLMNDFMDDPF